MAKLFKNKTTVKKQKGFTLVELAVVSIFLGQLAIFAITTFSTTTPNSSKARNIYQSTFKIANQWAQIAQVCSIPNDITVVAVGASAVTGTARKNLALVTGSSTAGTVANYSACYKNAGVRPLVGAAPGPAGGEGIIGYTISNVTNVSVGGRNYIAFDLSNVHEHIVLSLYNKYSSVSGADSATVVPATANTTDPLLRFSTATGGTRTVTILQPL